MSVLRGISALGGKKSKRKKKGLCLKKIIYLEIHQIVYTKYLLPSLV